MVSDNPNGFRSDVWGPHAWIFLHFVAQNYTVAKRDAYVRFFVALGDVLPCMYCRENYKKKLKATLRPQVLTSRRSFTKWVFDIHNMVNRHLKKPSMKNFDRYYRVIETYRSK